MQMRLHVLSNLCRLRANVIAGTNDYSFSTDGHACMTSRRLAAILVADVVGYSSLIGKDEEGTVARIKSLRREVVEPAVNAHKGRIFKTSGDGFLVEFSSPVEAVRCAMVIQDACRQTNAQECVGLQLRIGINLGDIIIEEDGDVYGDGVNVASRLEQLAIPSGISISGKIYEEVRDKLPYYYEDVGLQKLKNIARPIRVYNVFPSSSTSRQKMRRQFAFRSRAFQAVPLPVFLIVSFVALSAAGSIWWNWSGTLLSETGPAPTILVLPFDTADSQDRTRLLSDGLTDELITGLSRFSSLRILGRNTSNALHASAADVSTLRSRYGVNYLARGAVQIEDEKITLRAELIEAASGAVRWSERFDVKTGLTINALDEVASRIASTVVVRVNRIELEESRRKPSVALNAYELTLRGRQLSQRPNREALGEARSLFIRAAELDPHYAPPLSLAAFTFLTAYNNSWSEEFAQSSALYKMLELAGRALEIDPDLASAHAAQAVAYVYLGRHAEAQVAAASALASNPNDTDVLGRIGQIMSFSGNHQEAIGILRRAIDLDPFGPAQWFNFLSRAHFFMGEDAEAITAAQLCLDRSKLQPCRETLIAAMAMSGQVAAAFENWKQVTADRPQVTPEALVARLRPAFRNKADLDRLVEGLTRASEWSAQP